MPKKLVTNPENYSRFTREEALNYADVVQTMFAPLYPVLARVLIERFGITSGICIDIGSGTAALAMELAGNSNLTVYAVDHADEIQNIAERKVVEAGMEHRVKITRADVLSMPFKDNFADFIVSRGSLMFWKEVRKTYNEIYRVLKPGAVACIGGGYGSKEIGDQIKKKMIVRNPDFKEEAKQRFNPEVEKRLEQELKKSMVPGYSITRDDTGFWITFQKR